MGCRRFTTAVRARGRRPFESGPAIGGRSSNGKTPPNLVSFALSAGAKQVTAAR
jgi:hypothetical protein